MPHQNAEGRPLYDLHERECLGRRRGLRRAGRDPDVIIAISSDQSIVQSEKENASSECEAQ